MTSEELPKLRIVWVCYSRILESTVHLSGSERIERLRYLSGEGNEAYLIAGKFRKELYQHNQKLHLISIPLKYSPVLSPVLYGLALFFFLPVYLVKAKPDFLISDVAAVPFLVWTPIMSRLLGFKTILDVRSTPVSTGIRSNIYFLVAVHLAKAMFDGMTIVTPMMRDEICQAYGINPERVGVLSNGISDDFLAPRQLGRDRIELRKRFGLAERFIVIYHGSLDRSSGGLIESIEAIGLVKRDYPDIVLFILGSGTAQTLLTIKEAIAKNDVIDNVFLHGPVDFHSVPKYIAMSDVGLVPLKNIPTWRYQQPLKLLEYMAMRKTVIVSESPAHRSVIGASKNAIYVPQVNSVELARAIEYAYNNRNMLEEWGKLGYEIILEKYVWKKVNECLTTYLSKIQKNAESGEIYRARVHAHFIASLGNKSSGNGRRGRSIPSKMAVKNWRLQYDSFARYRMQLRRRRKYEQLVLLSQFCHLGLFALRRPETQLECGRLITSIDVDVGSKAVGEKNQGRNDANLHWCLSERQIGAIEERTIPLIVRFFDELEIPVTFAVRGQLTETENITLDLLTRSAVQHDIGAHGYYHRIFTSLSSAEAQNELELIYSGMNKLGLKPRSFIFPKNKVNHLSLLEKFGYICYRDVGGLVKDRMQITKQGQLYDIHPSFHLGATYDPIFLDKIIDIAAGRRLPLHLWFHPRDLFEISGSTQKTIARVLLPLYKHAKLREQEGTLKFETMYSIAHELDMRPEIKANARTADDANPADGRASSFISKKM